MSDGDGLEQSGMLGRQSGKDFLTLNVRCEGGRPVVNCKVYGLCGLQGGAAVTQSGKADLGRGQELSFGDV